MNTPCAVWVIDLLAVQPHDRVLEVGFGPGGGIALLAQAAAAGSVAGVDASVEMVRQATARNRYAMQSGWVDVRHGTAECLPFAENTFDKALAMNAMQVWTDVATGLREMRRVLKPGGSIALAFTPYAGQPKEGVPERLTAAAFTEVRMVESALGFCVLARKP
jgi:ubiquinone/menaquinone biosynthesis C-methylase UbiE